MTADPLDGCSAEGCDGDPFKHGGVLGERGRCQDRPLCANHYDRERRTWKRGHPPVEPAEPDHGTYQRYRTRVGAWRCRCDACRKANAERKRAQRAR